MIGRSDKTMFQPSAPWVRWPSRSPRPSRNDWGDESKHVRPVAVKALRAIGVSELFTDAISKLLKDNDMFQVLKTREELARAGDVEDDWDL